MRKLPRLQWRESAVSIDDDHWAYRDQHGIDLVVSARKSRETNGYIVRITRRKLQEILFGVP